MRPVGAEEFGAHPARFLQRVAAGEDFLVTRRGRPMARVLPPVELDRADLAQPTLPDEPAGADAELDAVLGRSP